jgi:hypothetical protein
MATITGSAASGYTATLTIGHRELADSAVFAFAGTSVAEEVEDVIEGGGWR